MMGRGAPFLQFLPSPESSAFLRFLLLVFVLDLGRSMTETRLLLARDPGQQSSSQTHSSRNGTTQTAPEIAAAAQKAMRNRDYAAAIENFKSLERMLPGSAEIHANLATAYYSA